MTRPPDEPPVGGVPASIAAIMAAIRHEVAGPAAAASPPATDPGPTVNTAAVSDAAPVADAAGPAVGDAAMSADDARDVAGGDPRMAAPALPPHLDGEVRTVLAPLLKAWLDAHLPEIVETAVAAEIRRLTGTA